MKAYKPLEKVKKFPAILKTFEEILREIGTFKAFEGEKTGTGTSIIYTVPVGKIFYMISAMLGYRTDHLAAPSSAYCYLLIDNMPFLILDPPDVISIDGVISLTPTIAIKLLAGKQIKVYVGDAKLYARGVISGYEISEDLKLKF